MGLAIFNSRNSDEFRKYKKAVKMAKEAIETICDLTEDMENEFSERGNMAHHDAPYGGGAEYRSGGYVMSERDWNELQERRRRDSMGQYR